MAEVKISKKFFLLNSASSGLMMAANLGVMLWLQPFLLARVSPEEYAMIPIVLSTMAFVPVFTSILTLGLGQFVTVAHSRGEHDRVRSIVSTALPLYALASTVLAIIGVVSVIWLPHFVSVPPEHLWKWRWMLGLSWIPPITGLILAPFQMGFIITNRLVYGDLVSVACQAVRLVMLVFLMTVMGASVLWVITAQVASQILEQTTQVPFSLKLAPSLRYKKGFFDPAIAKALLAYGSWALLSNGAQAVKNSIDPLLLSAVPSWSHAKQSTHISAFHVGGVAPRQITGLLGILLRPMIPVMAILHGSGNQERCSRFVLKSCRYLGCLAAIMGGVIAVLGTDLMDVYIGNTGVSNEFLSIASAVVTLLSIALCIQSMLAPVGIYAMASARVKPWGIIQAIIQSGNILVTATLLFGFGLGAKGSALGTATYALLLEIPIVFWFITKAFSISWLSACRHVLLPVIGTALCAGGITAGLHTLIAADSWIHLLSIGAITAVVVVASTYTFVVEADDKIQIKKSIHRGFSLLSARANGNQDKK
ncbi:MAG: hypothetical protein CSA62_12660 [Planctomycetota bacterium]|nr:MAG: hypothetical protein CSA62_12660 [Planctomycetota bacterium]